MWRNINDRGGGKLDFVWLTSRLPGLRRGAIELYNCPDQETNDPESGRSWAIFKPGELKHILEEKTSWFSSFHSCRMWAAVISHHSWIFVFHDWVDVGLDVTSYQTRFDKHETTRARERNSDQSSSWPGPRHSFHPGVGGIVNNSLE